MSLNNKRVTLVANTSWYLANFRHDLASALREAGAEVHCIAPPRNRTLQAISYSNRGNPRYRPGLPVA